MTKYNKEALDAAEDSVAFSRGHTNRGIATAVSDSMTRAPWWEEAEVGYEFRQGEPYRVELSSGVASEHTTTHIYTIHTNSQIIYFRDTRWRPPVKPLKVGDLIDTVAQAESLPIRAMAVTEGNAVFQKSGTNMWQRVDKGRGFLLADRSMAGDGDRIIYLPRGDFE